MQRAEALPARYREVIILREFEELSILEIAERLRYTVRTVTTHLFRGRSMPLAAVRKSLTAIPKG